MTSFVWPTSSNEGARRLPQLDAKEIWWLGDRVSVKSVLPTWQLAQATFPVSPCVPSEPSLPSFSPSRSGPANRGV